MRTRLSFGFRYDCVASLVRGVGDYHLRCRMRFRLRRRRGQRVLF